MTPGGPVATGVGTAMELRRWGPKAPLLPVVGMGTRKTFDVTDPAAEPSRVHLVDEALSAGTTVFDSSPMYGTAERVLGQALQGRRDQAFVATKLWPAPGRSLDGQVQDALGFFGGHVELYQSHNLLKIEEVLPRLKSLKSTGQARWIGATHFDPRRLSDLAQLMERGDIDVVQILYNASRLEVEERILPLAEQLGIGVFVMEPFGAGMLVAEDPPPRLLESLRAKGIRTWAQALLKWVLSDPRVHVVLPATRRPGRPLENAQAGRPPWLTPEERQAITGLFDR